MKISTKSIAYIHFWGDLINLFFAFCISIYFFQNKDFKLMEWVFFMGILLLWTIIGYSRRFYLWKWRKGLLSRSLSFTKSYFILVISVTFIFFLFNFPLEFKKIIIAFILGFLIMGLTTNFFIDIVVNFIKRKRNNKISTLVAGVGRLPGHVERRMIPHKKNHQIKGIINGKQEVAVVREKNVIGSLEDMNQYLSENQIDEVVIALPLKPTKKAKKILNIADYHGVRVKYIFDYKATFGSNCKLMKYGEFDAFNVRQYPLDEKHASFLKNTFDFFFSFAALIFLIPFYLLIGFFIKLDSPGPVFYCPTRIGKGGKPFKVFKFRTMAQNDDSNGGLLSTKKDDPRITKLGKYLRKYSIDELPQFINVFLGDMSVVGPRPHRSVLNKEFQQSEENYMIRHYFKPGITGWAQVNGWRGPTETKEQREKRTLHDLWYVENWSFMLDLKIIYKTIFDSNTQNNAF